MAEAAVKATEVTFIVSDCRGTFNVTSLSKTALGFDQVEVQSGLLDTRVDVSG